MNTTRALAITAATFLLPPTGFLAGLLAYAYWTESGGAGHIEDGRSLVFVPIVLFALSCTCLVGCARTRDTGVGIFLVLVAVGSPVLLFFMAASAFAY